MTTQFAKENEPRKFLDSWGVASILGIGRSTVHQLVKEGRLACVQVTKRTRRFTGEMVEEFIKSETVRGHKSRDMDFLEAVRIVH
jgi:excisionase family DNA binding protein